MNGRFSRRPLSCNDVSSCLASSNRSVGASYISLRATSFKSGYKGQLLLRYIASSMLLASDLRDVRLGHSVHSTVILYRESHRLSDERRGRWFARIAPWARMDGFVLAPMSDKIIANIEVTVSSRLIIEEVLPVRITMLLFGPTEAIDRRPVIWPVVFLQCVRLSSLCDQFGRRDPTQEVQR